MRNDGKNSSSTLSEETEKHKRKEKEKGKKLRASQWWRNKIAPGICQYCGGKFPPDELTMDHIVPLSRGGKSAPGNVAPACKECNTKKKYHIPAELILREQLDKDIIF
jgi:5-methylcytosine-specific restriction endonuclease McrA